MKLKLLSTAVLLLSAALSMGQGLTINPGTTFKTTAGVSIVVYNGNLLNNGNSDLSAGDLYMSGAIPANIDGVTPTSLADLYINKPSSSAALKLNLNVAGNVWLQNGLLDLNGFNLMLSPAGSLQGESETNRITGASGGVVSITLDMDAPLGDNPGNLGALIASTRDLGSVTIQRGHAIQRKGAAGVSIARYYTITPANNSALNAILRFKYLDAELNGLAESTLQMWKSINGGSTWSSLGFDGRNTTQNFVDISGVNSFSRYTLSTPTFSKTVKQNNLTAVNDGDKVMLSWTTETEFNSNKFIIERSFDNINWKPIGEKPAKGISLAPSVYYFNDNGATGVDVYYRVAEIDVNDAGAVTNIAKVTMADKKLSVTLTPNPVSRQGKVTITAGQAFNGILNVFAADGKKVMQQQLNLHTGANELNINASALAAGTYYLVVEMKDGAKKTIPFIKQ